MNLSMTGFGLSVLLLFGAFPAAAAGPYEVLWTCAGPGFPEKPLRTRFEPGAVVLTWEDASRRLEAVPSEVGARYALARGEGDEAYFWTRGDIATFQVGDTEVGCRAERLRSDQPMPQAAVQTPLALATALIDGRPRRVSRLEAVVGHVPDLSESAEALEAQLKALEAGLPDPPEGPIEDAQMDPQIDFYHFNPGEVKDPELGSWKVTFRGPGADAVAEVLRSRFGEGQVLAHRPNRPLRFGSFYWTRLMPGERFELAYHEYEPSWALPPRSEEETRQEIARVERFLTGGIDRASLEAAFGHLVPGPWNESLVGETRFWRISAHPAQEPFDRVFLGPRGTPIPAGHLIRTLGITQPVAVSHDVHWVERDLEDRETGMPTIGDYRIEVSIDHHGLELVKRESERYTPPTWRSTDFPIDGIHIRARRDR